MTVFTVRCLPWAFREAVVVGDGVYASVSSGLGVFFSSPSFWEKRIRKHAADHITTGTRRLIASAETARNRKLVPPFVGFFTPSSPCPRDRWSSCATCTVVYTTDTRT